MKTSEMSKHSFPIPMSFTVVTILCCIYLYCKTNQNEWAYIGAIWICYSFLVLYGVKKLYFFFNKLIIIKESNRHYGSYDCLIGTEKAFIKNTIGAGVSWPAIKTKDGLIYAVLEKEKSYDKIVYVINKLGCNMPCSKGYIDKTGFVANS